MPHIIAVSILQTTSAYKTSWQDSNCESILSTLATDGLVFNVPTFAEPFNVTAVKGIVEFHLIIMCIHSGPTHAIP